MTAKIRTCLWMEHGGGEAARLYTSLVPGSELEAGDWPGDDEPILVNFTLAGVPFQILNGGNSHSLSPAASISIQTEDQAETDQLWNALTADGGEAGRGGWLIDRWGVSWQIVPKVLMDMQTSDDQAAAERARQAMYKMTKLEISELEAAFSGA